MRNGAKGSRARARLPVLGTAAQLSSAEVSKSMVPAALALSLVGASTRTANGAARTDRDARAGLRAASPGPDTRRGTGAARGEPPTSGPAAGSSRPAWAGLALARRASVRPEQDIHVPPGDHRRQPAR